MTIDIYLDHLIGKCLWEIFIKFCICISATVKCLTFGDQILTVTDRFPSIVHLLYEKGNIKTHSRQYFDEYIKD